MRNWNCEKKMSDFYELMSCYLHLNEYHEYLFWKANDKRRHEIIRLEEYEHFDMRILPFEGIDRLRRDAESENYHMEYPDPLFFTGDFESSKVERTDYPIIDAYQFLVISKRLLAIIDSVKEFERTVVPTVIFDFMAENPFLPNNELRDDVRRTTGYVYLKLSRFVTIDKEKSRYHRYHKKEPVDASDLSFIEPVESLDPLFRIRQLPERIFVTEDVRNAIDEYNAKAEKRMEKKIEGIRLFGDSDYIDYY